MDSGAGAVTRYVAGFVGLTLAIVAVVSVVLFVLDTTAGEDFVLGEGFHPFTSDPDNDGCARSTDASGNAPNDCDPVNLAFEGLEMEGVIGALREAGWVTSGLGSTQGLVVDDAGGATAQDAQLFFSDSLDERLHVRRGRAGPTSG